MSPSDHSLEMAEETVGVGGAKGRGPTEEEEGYRRGVEGRGPVRSQD